MISPKKTILSSEYSLDIFYDSKRGKTQAYSSSLCVVRRGTSVAFRLKTMSVGIDWESLGLQLVTESQSREKKINVTPEKGYKTYFECISEKISEEVFFTTLKTTTCAPIGLYDVSITHGGELLTESLPIFILFNPHDPSDDVYCEDKAKLEDYLYHPNVLTHFGDNFFQTYRSYKLDQFSLECLSVSNIYLNRMKLTQRTSPIMVSRQITAFVNSNDDNGLIAGNWGKITYGKQPTYWKSMMDIYTEYLNDLRPVKWGQCFVFAGLVASLCRGIGIVCRAVTGFSIGHDDNMDGILTIKLSEETLKMLSTSETIWNFHCWDNAWFKRTDILTTILDSDSNAHGWQHIDGTPQERSEGIYQCGPFPISFMKSHIVNNSIPYDGLSVYHSINASVKYLFIGKDNEVVRENNKNLKRLLLTSNRYMSSIDISDEYIDVKPKPRTFDPSKLRAEIIVDASIQIGKPLSYEVKIVNTSEFSPTVMCLSLQLRNQFGRNILEETLEKSLVFTDKDTTIKGEYIVDVKSITCDISLCSFYWELRIFDQNTDKIKIVRNNTSIKPIFKGSIRKVTENSSGPTCQIIATIKNRTNLRLDDAKISVQIKHIATPLKEESVNFEPYETKEYEFNLIDIPEGYRKIFVYSIYGLCYQEIGNISHLAIN